MRQTIYLALFAALVILLAPSTQAAGWTLTVTALHEDGVKVEQASLTIVQVNRTESVKVRTGQRFTVGTVFIVPARTRMTLRSSNDNVLELLPGTRLKVSSGSENGEEFGLDAGKIEVVVRRALDFFNVRHDHFQAMVRGTQYSVEVIPQREIRFAVQEGRILIKRQARIRIEDSHTEGTIPVVEYIEAGQKRRYRLDIDKYFARFGNFGDAEAYYSAHLKADRASGDPQRLRQGLYQMGQALLMLSQFKKALVIFKEYLGEVSKDRDPENLAVAHGQLGIVYASLGSPEDLQLALQHLETAMTMYQELYPDGKHASIAWIHGAMGTVYSNMGTKADDEIGVGHYQRALSIYQHLFPNGIHRFTASTLTNLGVAYYSLGGQANLELATQHLNSARNILRHFPKDDGLQAAILSSLGIAHIDMGDPENIELGIRKSRDALAIMDKLFPNGLHMTTADLYNNLGAAYAARGEPKDLELAIEYYKTSLSIQQHIGPNGAIHRKRIAMLHGSLGTTYWELGRHEDLVHVTRHWEQALAMYNQISPNAIDYTTARAHVKLGMVYYLQGGTDNLLRAIKHYESAATMYDELFPDAVHKNISQMYEHRDIHANIGFLYRKVGGTDNIPHVINHLRTAITIYERIFPNEASPDVATMHKTLAETYRDAGGTENLLLSRSHFQAAEQMQQRMGN